MKQVGKLSDRLQDAAAARQATLDKLKAMPGPNSPEMVALREKQLEVAAAREARKAERIAVKETEARAQAEREAAAEVERIAQAERDAEEKKRLQVILAAEQKAARDAAYAARKKRKK